MSSLERPPPSPATEPPFDAAALTRALAIGALGGTIAHLLHVPLAYMLGALFAAMAASLAGARLAVPPGFRGVFLVVIGLFLGQSFGAGGGPPPATWIATSLMAVLYVPIAILLCRAFYLRVARLDQRTALLSSVPGGLSAVILFSSALGADERQVALTQCLRITFVVLAAPALFFGVLGYAEPDLAASPVRLVTVSESALLLVGSLAAAAALAALGAPLPLLIAPILASAAFRLTGMVEGRLPAWLVEAALVVVGAAIGARFAGAEPKALLRLAGWTLLASLILMALSALFALAAAVLFNADFMAALLAFAPGGVAEMCLIAIALDVDPSFVATHHVVRIAFILTAAPAVAIWLSRRSEEQG